MIVGRSVVRLENQTVKWFVLPPPSLMFIILSCFDSCFQRSRGLGSKRGGHRIPGAPFGIRKVDQAMIGLAVRTINTAQLEGEK